jgi:hypothetical protein
VRPDFAAILAVFLEAVPLGDITLRTLCVEKHPQQWLGHQADDHALRELLENPAMTQLDRARVRSAGLPFGGGWLLAPPSTLMDQRLPGRHFRLLARFRLGMPLSNVERTHCPCCQRGRDAAPVLDWFGGHAAMCHSSIGNSRRHNRVRDELCDLLRKGDFIAEKEAHGLLPGDAGLRPADILVQRWEHGRAACIDVSIVNPLAPTHVRGAAETAGYAAGQGEHKKRTKYGAHCAAARPPLILLPFVMETLGGVGPVAEKVLKRVGAAVAQYRGMDPSQGANLVGNRISFTCQRALGEALAERFPADGHEVDGPLQVVDAGPVYGRPPGR